MTSQYPAGAAPARPPLLDIATGQTRGAGARGAASNVRAGATFEDLVDAAWSRNGHAQRGHAATKVIRTARGAQTIYVAKNGVDFVGVYHHAPLAVECKRLPDAASLSGGKDTSTAAEARWLLAFRRQGGIGAFLVHDPDRERVYVVDRTEALAQLGTEQRVPLRDRRGVAMVPAFPARLGDEIAIEAVLRWLAFGKVRDGAPGGR